MDEKSKTFTLELGHQATNATSGEIGTVIGRAEYTSAEPNYLVRFKDSTGRAREEWWAQSALA